jgi:hypothetical protein
MSMKRVVAVVCVVMPHLAAAAVQAGSIERKDLCYCRDTAPTGAADKCAGSLGLEPTGQEGAAPSFAAWRRNVEILGFEVGESGRGTFTRTVRNVTRQDDVYLSIANRDAARHRITARVEVKDAVPVEFIGGLGQAKSFADIAKLLSGFVKATQTQADKTAQAAESAKARGDKARVTIKAARAGSQQMLDAAANAAVADEVRAALQQAQNALDRAGGIAAEAENALARAEVGLDPPSKAFDKLWPPDTAAASPDAALREAASALERANSALTGAADAPADLKEAVARGLEQVTALQGQLAALKPQVKKALQAQQDADARVADESALCLYLGRFEAGKSVSVSLSIAPATAPPDEADDADGLRKAAQAAYDTLGKVLAAETPPGERPGTHRAAAGEQKPTPAVTPAPAASPTPAPTTLDLLTYTFDVLSPVHVQTGMAFPVSWLRNPDFEFKPTRSETSGTGDAAMTRGFGRLVPSGDTRQQIRPAFMVALNLKSQHPGAVADADPYETVRPAQRYVPFIAFGVGLKDLGDDYFFGPGVTLGRGVQLVAGVHFGKVNRLIEGFEENKEFEKPNEDFQGAEAVVKRRVGGFFIGLSVDGAVVTRLFGGGS